MLCLSHSHACTLAHSTFQARRVTFIKRTRAPPDDPARLNSTQDTLLPLGRCYKRRSYQSATPGQWPLNRCCLCVCNYKVRRKHRLLLHLIFILCYDFNTATRCGVGGRRNNFIADKTSSLDLSLMVVSLYVALITVGTGALGRDGESADLPYASARNNL